MSLIEEHYQDEQGNWLPEAQEILAKATATQTNNKGTHTLLPMNEVEDFFELVFEQPPLMEPDGFKCPECGHRAKKTVSVHDKLRLVRITEDCPSCGYHKFQEWEKVETP